MGLQSGSGIGRLLTGSFGSNAAWQLVQTISATGSEIAVLLVLASALSPQAFGQLVVALSGSKIVFMLLEPRIHEFLIPRLARYLGKSSRGAWGFVRWSRAREFVCNSVALTACLVAGWSFPILPFGVKGGLLAATGVYVFSGTLMKYSSLGIFRCLGLVRIPALFALAVGVTKLVLLAECVRATISPELTMALLAVPAVLASAGLALMAHRKLAERIRLPCGPVIGPRLKADNRRKFRGVLLNNYATGLMEIGHRELDVQILAWLSGPIEAGRYRLAKSLAMSMLEAISPILLVLLPELSRLLVARGSASIRAFLHRIMMLMGAIGVLAGGAVAAVSVLYIRWFSPDQSAALVPTFVLIAGFVAIAPCMWSQPYLVAIGRSDVYMRGSVAGAVLAVLAAFSLVPFFGGVGAALAHLTGLLLVTGIALRYSLIHARAMAERGGG